jgi:hypothetical protein
VGLTVETPVVVGECVEGEVLDEPVHRDGHPSTPPQVVLDDRVVELEHVASQHDPLVGLGVGDLLDAYSQIVDLQDLDVTAKLRGHQGEIGRDIEHARVEVPEQAVPALPQRASYAGGPHPLGDPRPGALILQVAGHGSERHTTALEGVGHLGQRACTAVGEPLPGVEGRVIHDLGRLQVDEQHRSAAALRDRHEHRRRYVRRQEADDEVTPRSAELLRGVGAVLRVRDKADVHDVAVQSAQPLRGTLRRPLQLRQQVRELRPVGAEPT